MLRKIFATILLLSLFSCGFQVIYKDENSEESHAHDLAAIRIQKDHGRLSQEMRNNLYDLLNPDYIKSDAKYLLILSVKETTTSTFITSTGSSGRNKVILDISYELKNIENAAIISTGTTSVNDNYDVSVNRYGTYVADEYVQNNLTKLAAQNIRNSLVNDFIETRKKCEGKIEIQKDEKFTCPFDAPKEESPSKP